MTKNDGGSAFPEPGYAYSDGSAEHTVPGMSLRQFYAAATLVGELAADMLTQKTDAKKLAEWCFNVADAMIQYEQNEKTCENPEAGPE